MHQVISGLAIAALISVGIAFAGPAGPDQSQRFDPPSVSVYFPQGESELTAEAAEVLDETAQNVKERQAERLIVTGYADSSASEASSLDIASARAAAVKRALIDRGVAPALILIVAGTTQATSHHDTPAAFIGDRRAEITIEPHRAFNF